MLDEHCRGTVSEVDSARTWTADSATALAPSRRPGPIRCRLEDDTLFVGEYPGATDASEVRRRIGALLDAGITVFVDLTAPSDGLQPYEDPLAAESLRRGLSAFRLSFPVPHLGTASPAVMRRILDVIAWHLEAGRRVYVHGAEADGRAELVLGCRLVRHGADGDAALSTTRRLLADSPDADRNDDDSSSSSVEQRELVRRWSAHERGRVRVTPDAEITRRQRFQGALLGLAVGDALGTTLEYTAPDTFIPIDDIVGGGPFRLEPGQWTDDTSMALCLAESLLERRGFDAEDQMRRYVRWWRNGHWSSTGRCFDIGNTVRQALANFERTGVAFSGSTSDLSANNGSLMRIAPVAMYFVDDPGRAVMMAAESSRTTHGASAAVDACRCLAGLLVGALSGASKEALLAPHFTPSDGEWFRSPLHPKVAAVAGGSFREKSPPGIRGTAYVVDSLEAALWAFATTDDFRSGALAAVNLGDDADTTGAVYGQLAGAFYGVDAIPLDWRERVARAPAILEIADTLLAAAEEGGTQQRAG